MLSSTTFLLSKTFLLSIIYPPLWQPMLSSTTFLSSKIFLFPSWQPMLSMIQDTKGHLRPYLTQVPWAAHAFKYNIPFIKSIPFIQNLPSPLGSPCFQVQHSFVKNIPFIKILPPPFGSPCFQVQHSFYQKHSFYQNFPPLLAAHAFNDSGYQGSSATLPDLSVKNHSGFDTISRFEGFMVYGFLPTRAFNDSGSSTTFLLSKNSAPLLAAHAFNDSGYQGSSATLPDLSPVGSPCFQVQEQPATSQHHA